MSVSLNNIEVRVSVAFQVGGDFPHVTGYHSEGRAETILADFETASGNVASLTTDLRQTNKRLDRIFEDTPVIMENLKKFTVEINNTTDGLNTLLDQSGGRVDTILADFETASGNIAILTTDLRQTSKRFDTLLVSTNDLVSKSARMVSARPSLIV